MIVWDLGGVVTTFRPDRRLAALAEAAGLPAKVIDARIWGSGLDAAAERGELSAAAVWAAVVDATENRASPAALRSAWSAAFVPNREVLALLDTAPGPAALLTNNGPILEACLAHELRGVAECFDHILLSWRLGHAKPDPDVFSAAADVLGLTPSRLLLVDDDQLNVNSATNCGWRAVLYTDPVSAAAAVEV